MDQQATIVKELENDVMRCVWDQNGNHVIQKAIEMVPPEYVRFIVNAFKGQVKQSAIHPYGCRVVQRMLEHCEQNDREFILNELHANTSTLIPDVYGNYVIQHVIENGEYEDRNRIISVVMSSVLRFSKHKYASNVVEKSIEFGNEIQKQDIIRTLTSPSEKGEDPLLDLIPDQYANYVIRKCLLFDPSENRTNDSTETVLNELYKLNKTEWNLLVQRLQPMLPQLKKSGSSKQIASIENVILKLNPALAHPPTSSANSSTTPPASHKSSPLPSRRSFNDRLPEVGAAPPTPPPTETQSPNTGSAHAGSPDGAEELW
jgi:mRNA-binding protein PUF3